MPSAASEAHSIAFENLIRRQTTTSTRTTGAFLLLQFLRGAGDFGALLRFVRTLALVGQVLLHVEVHDVLVRLVAEHGVGQRNLAAGVFAFAIEYGQFHL